MFLQFFEGMMTLFYLVGKCLHLDGAVLYFNYFSQCYNVVMVYLYVSCIDMGYMYALSWKLLIIGTTFWNILQHYSKYYI